MTRANSSGRHAVLRFAAHFAHLLNTNEELNPGQLYRTLIRTLSGEKRSDKQAFPYVESLVGIHLMGPGISSDEAANTYFELVLNRPLFLSGRKPYHKGQEVHLALCKRGKDYRWSLASLERSTAQLPNDPPKHSPPELKL